MGSQGDDITRIFLCFVIDCRLSFPVNFHLSIVHRKQSIAQPLLVDNCQDSGMREDGDSILASINRYLEGVVDFSFFTNAIHNLLQEIVAVDVCRCHGLEDRLMEMNTFADTAFFYYAPSLFSRL